MSFEGLDLSKHYYYLKPFIPRRLQILLRSAIAIRKRQMHKDIWPIDRQAGKAPGGWMGWPDDKRFALVLTHDVDTAKGHDRCYQLMQMEKTLGFCSSFNFVATGYKTSGELRRSLTQNGYEVGVHGLIHSRKSYESKEIFQQHAARINQYLKEWDSVGFRSPCMYHNLDWIHELDIEYDASTFDTDPFEPQPDGVGTIFPFWVGGNTAEKGYVELPYTLPQDFTLFILMKEKNIETWKQKLKWVVECGGMVLLNVHPDYMNFSGTSSYQEYDPGYYQDFLAFIRSTYEGQYWHVLPKEMASFWTQNYGWEKLPEERDAPKAWEQQQETKALFVPAF